VNRVARWLPFEHFREYGWQDEPLISCHLGKVFQFSQGRNAWWGQWSQLYPGFDSFSPTIREAKTEIERSRKQGSTWRIRELPALVLCGRSNSVIVGEIHAYEPLWTFLKRKATLDTMEQAGRCFQPHLRNSIVRIYCESGLVPQAQRPFLVHESRSHGGNVPLSWRTSPFDESMINRTRRLVVRVNRGLNALEASASFVTVVERQVCDRLSVTLEELTGDDQSDNIVFARHVAMYLVSELTDWSRSRIALEFGERDQTAVFQATSKIRRLMRDDQAVDDLVLALTVRIDRAHRR
jgi:hypothetical protein